MIWHRIFRFVTGSILAILCWQAYSQAPSQPSVRVSVDLVQVDAVVTDSKGNHVRNLEAADFQVFEDGKPQKITSFSLIEAEPKPATAGKPISRHDNLRKEEVGSSIVLMFDDSGSHAEQDLLLVFPAVKKFITDKLGPRDLAAVTASRGGMGFYQQFTNDKQQLLSAIDRLSQRPGFGMWTLDIPLELNPDTGQMEPAFTLRPAEPGLGYRDPDHPPNPIEYLMWAIQGLQNIPGRKAVILFTHFFAAPQPVIDVANRAGVVIHGVDPHGFEGVVPSTAPYRQLAKQTGGLFLITAPGEALVQDLSKVLDDAHSYYLLGYRPEHADLRHSEGRPVRHSIKVKVLLPGLEVRARNGYLGTPDSGVASAPKTAAEQLLAAVSSPFSAGKIRMRLEPRYSASAPDPRTRHRTPLLRVGLHIDGRDLSLGDTEDGKKKLAYSVLVIVVSQDSRPAAKDARTFSFALTPEQATELPVLGVNPSLDLQLPGPGQFQIRAAIRDESSGEIGSAYQFVDVPDFNQPRITLSSIDLSSTGDGRNAQRTPWNGFAPESPLLFRCGVFGFRTSGGSPHAAQVDVQVILFRESDRRPFSHTGAVPVPASSLEDHYMAGQLNVASLPPGDYIMQLMAWDRLAARKKQLSAQWTRFTISTNR
jgi:VWFA-related protein